MQRGRNTSPHLWLSLRVQSSTPQGAANTADAGRLQNLAQQMSHQETLRALGSYGSACWVSVLKSPFRNKIPVFLFRALQYKSCFWTDSHRERLLTSWALQFLSHLWLLITRHLKSSTGGVNLIPNPIILQQKTRKFISVTQLLFGTVLHFQQHWNCLKNWRLNQFFKRYIYMFVFFLSQTYIPQSLLKNRLPNMEIISQKW